MDGIVTAYGDRARCGQSPHVVTMDTIVSSPIMQRSKQNILKKTEKLRGFSGCSRHPMGSVHAAPGWVQEEFLKIKR